MLKRCFIGGVCFGAFCDSGGSQGGHMRLMEYTHTQCGELLFLLFHSHLYNPSLQKAQHAGRSRQQLAVHDISIPPSREAACRVGERSSSGREYSRYIRSCHLTWRLVASHRNVNPELKIDVSHYHQHTDTFILKAI